MYFFQFHVHVKSLNMFFINNFFYIQILTFNTSLRLKIKTKNGIKYKTTNQVKRKKLTLHFWMGGLTQQRFSSIFYTYRSYTFFFLGDIHGTSLNNLVQLCLNKKLDKSNQFSNWEKRPLRKDQINYAGGSSY